MITPGPLLFARYAYPPNALGYCGPPDAGALLEYTVSGVSDPGLVDLAQRFEGAWPYLTLIAAASGRDDPLATDVVDAYWVGNPLLETIPTGLFITHLEERFRRQLGWGTFTDLAQLAAAGGRAHHNFHVFAVYPWVGMLRAGKTQEPLRVLDSCRVRCGRVVCAADGHAEVVSRPLCWIDGRLTLGPLRTEVVRVRNGHGLRPGDWVSAHWDWVCDTLSALQVRRLSVYTASILRLANTALERPAVAALLW